ncbi:hypothetical protein NpPPO83_00010425 [Neofusicoccum parvum]|uniref:Uncharacterized protein n=1 Tax=Neofusicoccum parvum TaxID=310453 RepID=A0ACB5RV88_9PEZI|nr:hypothetical protein NpPPO83_00010425 [Neofusicoccum parvum]
MDDWSPFFGIDSALDTNTSSTGEPQQQQSPNTTFGENCNHQHNTFVQYTMPTNLNTLAPPAQGSEDLDFLLDNNHLLPPTEQQYGVNNDLFSELMMDELSRSGQLTDTAWIAGGHQAKVQPGVQLGPTTPWTSAPFAVDQSGLHEAAEQAMPWIPTWATPFAPQDMQLSSNQLPPTHLEGELTAVEFM